MKYLLCALALAFAGAAAQAAERKLAGAARASFVKKCVADAGAKPAQ